MNELARYEAGPPAGPTDILEAFAAFLRLDVAQGGASPETLRAYAARVRHFADWCRENGIEPALATEKDLAAYRQALIASGLARSSVAAYLGAVRRFYDAAVWRGLRRDNPATGIRAPRERTAREERIRFLPLDALRRLLELPQGETPRAVRDRAILALMGVHGLRVSEVAGLRTSDIDLDAGTLRVHGKGRKERTVYLVDETARKLRAHLALRGDAGNDALFLALDRRCRGRPMTARAIRYLVDGYLEQLGLKSAGLSCHALRHSAATWARAAGASLDAIGDMLGHSSVDTTRVYAKIVRRLEENPARFLAALLWGKDGDQGGTPAGTSFR